MTKIDEQERKIEMVLRARGASGEELNCATRELVGAFAREHPQAHLGLINLYSGSEWLQESGPIWKYTGYLVNFGADFIIPEYDSDLEKMIVERKNANWNAKDDARRINEIVDRILEIGGTMLVWS